MMIMIAKYCNKYLIRRSGSILKFVWNEDSGVGGLIREKKIRAIIRPKEIIEEKVGLFDRFIKLVSKPVYFKPVLVLP